MKKRLAIIGIGMGGSYGARVHQNPNAELVAICSRSIEKLENRRKLYQKEIGANPKIYIDVDEMLAKENLDGAIVVTPSGTHHEIAIKIMQAGINVLVDKPLDINMSAVTKMIEAQKQSKVKAGVIYPNRFNATYRGLKNLIDSNELGRSLICDMRLKWYRDQAYYDKGGWKGTWSMDGGGSLMNQGAHPIDLLCWFFGRPIKVIGDFNRLAHKIETEDWSSAIIEFSSGTKCTITTTTCVQSNAGDRVYFDYHAEKGSVSLINGVVQEGAEHIKESPALVAHPVEDFIDALCHNRDPLISFEDASNSVQLINAIYESGRESRFVYP